METVNEDILAIVCNHLKGKSIKTLSTVNIHLSHSVLQLNHNSLFWKKRLENLLRKKLEIAISDWRDTYLSIYFDITFPTKNIGPIESEKELDKLLYLALSNRKINAAKVLIYAGSEIIRNSRCGCSISLTNAYGYGNLEVVDFVNEYGLIEGYSFDCKRCPNPLVMSCEHGRIDSVKRLLDGGYKFTYPHVSRAVKSACQGGYEEIAKIFISKFSDIIYDECLYEAIKKGHVNVLKVLMDDGGYQVNNILPMIEACSSEQLEVVKFFMERNPDLYIANSTVIDYAAMTNKPEIVKYLTEKGARSHYTGIIQPVVGFLDTFGLVGLVAVSAVCVISIMKMILWK